MNSGRLNMLVEQVKKAVEEGHTLALAINAIVFAYELTPNQAKQLKEALS